MNEKEFTQSEIEKINKALLVLKMLTQNPKMTQRVACENIGINPKTYRHWIATQEDALGFFAQVREEVERNELSNYLIAKSAIVDGLIEDATAKHLPVTDRLKVLKFIDDRIESLSSHYHPVDIQAEKDLLNGPATKDGINRLGTDRVSIEENSKETVIRVKTTPEIINILPPSTENNSLT